MSSTIPASQQHPPSPVTPWFARRWHVTLRLVAAALSVFAVVGVAVPGAEAAPYVSCNQPVYNGLKSAYVHCDALTVARVRLVAQCWNFPYIPAGNKYTSWVTIPAGQYRNVTFIASGWCISPGQIWSVHQEIAYG